MPTQHKYAGQTVAEILKQKQGRIKYAPLDAGSPAWDELLEFRWEEIDRRARRRQIGYRTIRKLLTDKEYDR